MRLYRALRVKILFDVSEKLVPVSRKSLLNNATVVWQQPELDMYDETLVFSFLGGEEDPLQTDIHDEYINIHIFQRSDDGGVNWTECADPRPRATRRAVSNN